MAELTGKAISELPAATTIGNDDLLALSQNGTSKKVTPPVLLSGVENEISGLNASLATYVRPNLLDNWYFVGGGSQLGEGIFPINQRGQASYSTAGYGIDRWSNSNATINSSIQVLAAGYKVTNTSASTAGTINQFLLEDLSGLTVTASMLFSDGTLLSGTGVFPAEGGINAILIARQNNLAGCMLEHHANTKPSFTITSNPSSNFTLKAVKLELGSTQTLAHQEGNTWVLNEFPDWYETLFRCRPDLFEPVRENLLDNWYFAGNGSQNGNFPINQRGQGYYTNAGVTIDRWFKGKNGAINSITKAYGLVITPNTALYQKLSTDTKNALDGKTCTLTLLTNDGKIRSGTFVYKSAPSSTITILNVAGVVKFECGTDGNIYITWLSSSNTGYFAIKLELGDTQTLAHQEGNTWVLNEIPDYAEQLAKCQRFFQVYRTQSLRPTYGADCRPVMASETPTAGTITSGSVTYYTLSSDL